MKILLILAAVFLALAVFWDFSRFNNVYNAQTELEIETACKEYQGSYIKNIPAKCFNYVINPNFKENL